MKIFLDRLLVLYGLRSPYNHINRVSWKAYFFTNAEKFAYLSKNMDKLDVNFETIVGRAILL